MGVFDPYWSDDTLKECNYIHVKNELENNTNKQNEDNDKIKDFKTIQKKLIEIFEICKDQEIINNM